MNIDRCYCYEKTFGELKQVADSAGVNSLSGLQKHVTFGENCELCHPYVERMLETGETSFDEIIASDDSSPR